MASARASWTAASILALALALVPVGAPAQTVTPIQGLSFGTLVPGIIERVAVTNVLRRAELEVRASGRVEILFMLPAAMTSAEGASIPLTFGATDAGYVDRAGGALHAFDPRTALRITMPPPRPVLWLYLGGSAAPTPQQAAGHYTATVTVIVAPPGT